MAEILLVEDQQNLRKVLSILLKNEGYVIDEARNGQQAIEKLRNQFFDLVITDLKMKSVDGMQVLKEVKQHYSNTEVIVITAFGTIESGVKAMKLGAYNYLTKPLNDEEFLIQVKRALEKRRKHEEVKYLHQELNNRYKFENIIGNSQPMNKVLKTVSQVAETDSIVLITGESGTGKELIARALHVNSLRRDNPLITVNCGALPENLMESELFGHVKGAFTGAVKDKKGLFQEADRCTLFLDEVGEISPPIQVKLLRFLQEGEIRRVGDNRAFKLDVRLIAATNRDLEDEVEKGHFREDLFYRLNVIPILLPPLRERIDDIPILVNHFLRKCANKLNREVPSISHSAMSLFMEYQWPGNVRELENFLERMVALTNKQEIDVEELAYNFPKNYKNALTKVKGGKSLTLAGMERLLILETLNSCSGNQKLASQKLGISTTTLWRKLRRYQIDLNDNKTR